MSGECDNCSEHALECKCNRAMPSTGMKNKHLEEKEDYYLSRLAEEAEQRASGKRPIPADVLWQELGLISKHLPSGPKGDHNDS